MVTKSSITKLANQYRFFFQSVKEHARSVGDRERASYGLDQTILLLKLLESVDDEFTNTELKQMHHIFTNMTRGVEYFEDMAVELKATELGNALYEVEQQILPKIRW